MKKAALLVIMFVLTAFVFGAEPAKMTVTSKVFKAEEMIPKEYTCEGTDISPDISWSGAPKGSKSFVIICDDPDIPVKTAAMKEWVHWVVYNIPADVRSIKRSQPKLGILPGGARQGLNDFRKNAYGGPCPPFGVHRYYFRVYAVDIMIDIAPSKADKKSVLEAIKGHIVGYGELMAKYEKAGQKGKK